MLFKKGNIAYAVRRVKKHNRSYPESVLDDNVFCDPKIMVDLLIDMVEKMNKLRVE